MHVMVAGWYTYMVVRVQILRQAAVEQEILLCSNSALIVLYLHWRSVECA